MKQLLDPDGAPPPRPERTDGADSVDVLTDEDGFGGVALVRTRLRPGGEGAPPHVHARITERFTVLEGALDVLVGDDVLTLEHGDALTVAPGVLHAFAARAGHPADVLIAAAPGAGRAAYFRLLAQVRRGEAEPAALLEAAERFDNHFIPSVRWAHHRDAA